MVVLAVRPVNDQGNGSVGTDTIAFLNSHGEFVVFSAKLRKNFFSYCSGTKYIINIGRAKTIYRIFDL